ncbi:MAG: L,D-transpeptidase/peptidoglycan binding protein [Actinobacteria bacterium]|nr:L,D-transpeptidase/peptidoglycan binding protein [Actinomycetota bacterium]
MTRSQRRRRRRRGRRGLLAVAALVVLPASGGALYDGSREDRLAQGVRVGGIDVGGLDVAAAKRLVHERAVAPRQRTLRVHTRTRTFVLRPAELGVRADTDEALDRALAASRRGWFGARLARDVRGGKVRASIPLTTRYARGVLPRLVAEVAAFTYVAPVDARVEPSAGGLERVPARSGSRIDTGALHRSLERAVQSRSRPADIYVTTLPVAPDVTAEDLAERYPAYIVIDRKNHVLRFFENLAPLRSWPIAVGRAGLETPAGLYDIQWKETNPKWRVPNSEWAGDLAGKTIPPGPDNPIKARWMAFNGGAGIHGIDPSSYGSIGTDASHGCVRMRIPDVISLYARSPVGTPVFVA